MIMRFLKHKELDYVFYAPDNFDKTVKYPAVLHLHGAGSRGRDIERLGLNPYYTITKKHEDMGFLTFGPQCYAETWFDIFEQLTEFAEFVRNCEFTDEKRIYLMGASMGGYASWQLAISHPAWFAAALPICGGGMYWDAGRLKNLPVWAFHGEDDSVVLPEESRKMVNAVNAAGGNAKLTVYPGRGHDSWSDTYENREIFEWMLMQQNNNAGAPQSSEFDGAEIFG